jgi:hypothetical protein
MPLADGTPLIASDGSLMLDTDGSVRLADGVSDDCCCGCGDDCTCDPDAIPSSLTIDMTNLDLSGCSESANCSPDGPSTQPASITYLCDYRTDASNSRPWYFCWDGKKLAYIDIEWRSDLCRWTVIVSIALEGAGGGMFYGPACFSNGPVGTYISTDRPGSCARGSIEVS